MYNLEIRNIAIIAHVDHGKTTLTDMMLRQTGMVKDASKTMDSYPLEQERGLTIYSKNTSLFYKNTKINIIDTPGHVDLGSEVERVLRSVDSVLLLVDAQEGPMPQTRFVLKKSLELGLKSIVVINKIDKPAAEPEKTRDLVLELFIELGASDEQLDFATVYTIARDGIAKISMDDDSKNLNPLLDTILKTVPRAESDTSAPFRVQPFNLAYDDFLGRMAIGRVYEGILKEGSKVIVKKPSGEEELRTITKLFTFEGFERKEVSQVVAGDIVMAAGIPDIYIGATIYENASQKPLPAITVEEPTISLNFLVNNSPFAGREGKFVTSRQLGERLKRELEVNIGLKVDFSKNNYYKVLGRGEMHISVLLENMRREGYELQVSQPQVIIKEEDGKKLEPFEEVTIDTLNEFEGVIISKLSKRKGIMTDMKKKDNQKRLIFEIPTRGLLGYREEFIMDTHGQGVMCSRVIGFKPYVGKIKKHSFGSMVSMAKGKVLGFSLNNLQQRGILYVKPGIDVYEGMIIGSVAKGYDMDVNPTKGKQLSNMRASGSDEAIKLTPAKKLTLEGGLEIMAEDEYLEVTPSNIRLRKQFLKKTDRKRERNSD